MVLCVFNSSSNDVTQSLRFLRQVPAAIRLRCRNLARIALLSAVLRRGFFLRWRLGALVRWLGEVLNSEGEESDFVCEGESKWTDGSRRTAAIEILGFQPR
jgi:hypothetical protein